MMTNCKNCGAPLNHGKCEYCGTIYELPNELHIKPNSLCKVQLVIEQENQKIFLPLVGRVSSVEVQNDYDTCIAFYGESRVILARTGVHFEFDGEISNED